MCLATFTVCSSYDKPHNNLEVLVHVRNENQPKQQINLKISSREQIGLLKSKNKRQTLVFRGESTKRCLRRNEQTIVPQITSICTRDECFSSVKTSCIHIISQISNLIIKTPCARWQFRSSVICRCHIMSL